MPSQFHHIIFLNADIFDVLVCVMNTGGDSECYTLLSIDGTVNKRAARASCSGYNKTLATIASRFAELQLMKAMKSSGSEGAWVGLNIELNRGREWKWLHGE